MRLALNCFSGKLLAGFVRDFEIFLGGGGSGAGGKYKHNELIFYKNFGR
jgi:hypothetical protein